MKALLTVITICLLAGCANGEMKFDTSSLTEQQIQDNQKIFLGIPVFMGMEGSTVRLDNNWLVTAAHNKGILLLQPYKEVYYHPDCDIALIKDKGHTDVNVGTSFFEETVSHVGYPMALPLSVNQGVIVGDIYVSNYPDCLMTATTGVIAAGMSGGGVYNNKGELIGINHGYTTSKLVWEDKVGENLAVYVHLKVYREWIESVTGKDYWND